MLTDESKLRAELSRIWSMYDSSKTACAERDARIAELERELEEARRKATEDAYEFNRAINFAIEQGLEACHFLAAWREGDPSGWPEFDAAIKEQT